MADRIEYSALQCPTCAGTTFLPLYYVKHKPGSGLVEDKAGWLCTACQTPMDLTQMLAAEQVRSKREELRLLELELGIDHADSRS